MNGLSHSDVVTILIALSFMLLFAKLFGEFFRFLKQPSVVGEIIAGIVLGPTILGFISPEIFNSIFPASGNASIALEGFIAVAVILLLFIAGIEVELDIVRQQGKSAVFTSIAGLIIPFALGFVFPWYYPEFFGIENDEMRLLFALFVGTAMSITALPVIVRILIDMGIFKSKIGMTIVSSAMINDLIGWIFFSVILSQLGTQEGGMSLGYTVLLTIGFALLMLSLGKKIIDLMLPWINKRFAWPGGLMAIAMTLCFLGAAFTEFIGIHAIFGAFIMGVAIGDSTHMSGKAKEIIHQFVNNIFAPLFFVSIGLKVNFIANFDPWMVLVVLLIAFAGKIIGSGLGARLSGFNRNESLTIGFGMNARGAMEIILGLLALEAGLINETLFVALVVMALLTSITSGPLMKLFIDKK